MNATNIFRILARHWKVLLLVPFIAALIVFFLLGQKPKEYKSEMSIYTGFGSGYSLMNTGATQRYDYYAVNNAFDNLINTIKSEAVLQEVGITLFAQGMIYGGKQNNDYISANSYEKLQELVPDSIKKLIDKKSIDNTITNLTNSLKNGSSNNFMYKLLNLYHPYYSLWALNKIEIKRVGSSDILDLTYSCEDPAVCYQTLKVLSETFVDFYKGIRFGNTHSVVKYFEEQLSQSGDRLKSAEDLYMEFNKQNRVINYYEQTKSIAGQLQAFELNYDQVLALNARAKTSYEILESKIGVKMKRRLEASDVLDKRGKIAFDFAQSVTSNVFKDDSTYQGLDMNMLNKVVAKGKSELLAMLDTVSTNGYTAEGIAIDNILDEWLTNKVTYDATEAALIVLDKRRNQINGMFDFYAPVGATVKRKEREIGVNEQEYLSLLHSLALAKLSEQDIQLSSSALKVTADPVFPISAEPSKRKILTLLTFLAVLILVTAIILAIELSDRTMRSIAVAEKLSGLGVLGVYPFRPKNDPDRYYEMESIANGKVVSEIFSKQDAGVEPLVVNILSMEPMEGKTQISGLLAAQLRNAQYNVFTLNYSNDIEHFTKEYIGAKDIATIANLNVPADIYIVEHPAVVRNTIAKGLINPQSVNFVVCRANRAWHESDRRRLSELSSMASTKVSMILNGVEYDDMEDLVGEVPKHRSKFRRCMKKYLRLEFASKHKL